MCSPIGQLCRNRARSVGCGCRSEQARPRNPMPLYAAAPPAAPHLLQAAPHLLQIVLQLAGARRVPELAQRLGLDLADALAGDVELLANFLESAGSALLRPKAELQDSALAASQRVKDRLHLFLQELMGCGLSRSQGAPVLDEVAQVRILFLADRRLERHGLLADLDNLADLLRRDHLLLALGHGLRDLIDRRFAAQLLEQGARDSNKPVDRLDHVDRDADGAGLVGDGTRDGLADPPRRVGAELEALLVVELLDRTDQADVALLNQVQEAHAPADVLLGDRHDEPEVGRGQLLARVAADSDQLATPMGELGVEGNFRVVAETLEQVGVTAAL